MLQSPRSGGHQIRDFPRYLMYSLNAGAGVAWRVGPKDLGFDRPLGLVKLP
jgi:hypothetical protein